MAIVLTGCSKIPVGPDCPKLLPRWSEPRDGLGPFRGLVAVGIVGAQPMWDGQPVDMLELDRRLEFVSKVDPAYHILFDPSGASTCLAATELRDRINRVADCQGAGVCGQGAEEEFIRRRFEDSRTEPGPPE